MSLARVIWSSSVPASDIPFRCLFIHLLTYWDVWDSVVIYGGLCWCCFNIFRKGPLPCKATLMPRLHQDTCSPDTSCIYLYPDTSCSSGILVSGYAHILVWTRLKTRSWTRSFYAPAGTTHVSFVCIDISSCYLWRYVTCFLTYLLTRSSAHAHIAWRHFTASINTDA